MSKVGDGGGTVNKRAANHSDSEKSGGIPIVALDVGRLGRADGTDRATHYLGKPFRDHSVIVGSVLIASYCTNITRVTAGGVLAAALAAIEYHLCECMEVCKRENARSDDTVHKVCLS